ncbi:MAG: macro domain-containing protein [Gemmatimonadota bacterium]|nr:macro domain-containing protein [Gemmatimonadota bacterium]MDE3217304.1 macro domain-containing protein [Gemmatimonadota bacterium]
MIEVRIDDLAFYEGEAIAWPVDATLGATTPLLRRLERAAGSALAARGPVQQALPVGAAVVTNAGDLKVELLINAVIVSAEERASREGVRRALVSALQRAADFAVGELAVAPFGIGAGNLDVEESATVMADVMREHLARAAHPQRIVVIVENDVEEAAWQSALRRTAP